MSMAWVMGSHAPRFPVHEDVGADAAVGVGSDLGYIIFPDGAEELGEGQGVTARGYQSSRALRWPVWVSMSRSQVREGVALPLLSSVEIRPVKATGW
jgi:hypothetical protein